MKEYEDEVESKYHFIVTRKYSRLNLVENPDHTPVIKVEAFPITGSKFKSQ